MTSRGPHGMPASPQPSWSTSPPVYLVFVSLALSLCYTLLSSDANNFAKGTLLATPRGTPAFPQAFMVVVSTGLFLCLPHSSLSLSRGPPPPAPCIISWSHPVRLGPIVHGRCEHYLYCTVSLIRLFYHFKSSSEVTKPITLNFALEFNGLF